jgi:hypothetical protein
MEALAMLCTNIENQADVKRCEFLNKMATAIATLAIAGPTTAISASADRRKIKLGFSNFSLRSHGWKAGVSIENEASQKTDTMFFYDLDVFESHEDTYITTDFWKAFPNARASEFACFLSFAKKRKDPVSSYRLPTGKDKKSYDQEFQKADLERSLKYCKEVLGLGLKS